MSKCKQVPRVRRFTEPVYGSALSIVITDDKGFATKWIGEDVTGMDALTVTDGRVFKVWMGRWDVGLAGHEAYHVVRGLLESIHFKDEIDECEEPAAYYMQWVLGRIEKASKA